MNQFGSNSPMSQYGEEVTALSDKSIFDLQSRIDKDASFTSPLEGLGALGGNADFSVYGGTGKGSREKGQMYNLIAGLLSGVASGAGEDFTRDNRTEAKNSILQALTKRDPELLGQDSRMKPYKDEVNLFNERLGGLEAKAENRVAQSNKGLEAILGIPVDSKEPTMTPYQEQNLALRKQEVDFKNLKNQNDIRRSQGLPPLTQLPTNETGDFVGNVDGQNIKIDPDTAKQLEEAGYDLKTILGEVGGAESLPTNEPQMTESQKMIQNLGLPYNVDDFKFEGGSIPSKYSPLKGTIEKLINSGATPAQAKDIIENQVNSIEASDAQAFKDFQNEIKTLQVNSLETPKNAIAFESLNALRDQLRLLKAQKGDDAQIGTWNTALANVSNKLGIGEGDPLAMANSLVESLQQYWTGASRTPGVGSQSDIEFRSAVSSFQNPNLSLGARLKEVDKIVEIMNKNNQMLNLLKVAPYQGAGYRNALAFIRQNNLQTSTPTQEPFSSVVPEQGMMQTPTPTPTPVDTSYQAYLNALNKKR